MMRLLSLTTGNRFQLTAFEENNLPAYAILSHTWEPACEEVTYEELIAGMGQKKAGYSKLRFCQERAAQDNLRYFWVDTCCINKKQDPAELSVAIHSMFRWYRRATKCYVYLSDVQVPDNVVDIDAYRISWEDAFRRSRWFGRGWTLQELLAPASVEFFSKDGRKVGSKISLEREIHEITQIPIEALRKFDLRDFSINDRISWVTNRKTTVEEDKAYCLLGIFDISLALLYGEGEVKAMQRLKAEIKAQTGQSQSFDTGHARTVQDYYTACLRSLGFSSLDARQNDIALAHHNTCDWLFETAEFCKWRDQADLADHNGVLWLKGKPGAGKSTLMKHTLHHCQRIFSDHMIVAYFFNARGERLEKTALGMLRSMVYQLVEGDHNIRDRFVLRFRVKQMTHGLEKMEWRLSDLRDFVLTEIVQHHSTPIILLVDALDECSDADVRDVVNLLKMLSARATQSKASLRICLSSRHYPFINMKKKIEFVVESSEAHRDDIARYVTDELEVDEEEVSHEIQRKADGVFLWAVLVVAMLNDASRAGRIEEMHEILEGLPGDLEKVFDTILAKDDAHRAEMVLMLQLVLFSPRPLKATELFFAAMTKAPRQLLNPSRVTSEITQRRITASSKGLIEVRPGDNSRVQFIHRSVNDFLLRNQRLQKLDPTLGPEPERTSHRMLWACCREYINLADPTQISSEQIAEQKSKHPFMEYALAFVFAFANKALSDDEGYRKQQPTGDMSLIERYDIIGSRSQDDEIWQWVQGCEDGWFQFWRRFVEDYRGSKPYFEVEVDIHAGLLYNLSLNGYQRVVKVVLSQHGTEVNAQGGQYGTALQAASADGSQEVVELLFNAGAEVNIQGGYYGTALQAASADGSQEVVELLLNAGAEVNIQGGYYGTALQAASADGWQDVVELLLNAGAVK
jgi:hypothetical protein